jgi:hypothetical protein
VVLPYFKKEVKYIAASSILFLGGMICSCMILEDDKLGLWIIVHSMEVGWVGLLAVNRRVFKWMVQVEYQGISWTAAVHTSGNATPKNLNERCPTNSAVLFEIDVTKVWLHAATVPSPTWTWHPIAISHILNSLL